MQLTYIDTLEKLDMYQIPYVERSIYNDMVILSLYSNNYRIYFYKDGRVFWKHKRTFVTVPNISELEVLLVSVDPIYK